MKRNNPIFKVQMMAYLTIYAYVSLLAYFGVIIFQK